MGLLRLDSSRIVRRERVEQMRADIQAVVFDLDGTLLDRRRSFERFVQEQWERFANCLLPADQEHYVHTLIELDRDWYAPRSRCSQA